MCTVCLYTSRWTHTKTPETQRRWSIAAIARLRSSVTRCQWNYKGFTITTLRMDTKPGSGKLSLKTDAESNNVTPYFLCSRSMEMPRGKHPGVADECQVKGEVVEVRRMVTCVLPPSGCSVGVAGAVGVECSSPSNLSPQHGFPTTPGRCMSPPHSLDPPPPPPPLPPPPPPSSNILSTTTTITQLAPLQVPPPTAVSPKANSSSYKFHYSFPQPYGDAPRKELSCGGLPNGSMDSPMTDVFSHVSKRSRLTPPLTERLMLYVRQDGEDVYTPLHLVPPSTVGLRSADEDLHKLALQKVKPSFKIEEKYKIPTQTIKNIYRKNKVGVMAKVDDEMLRHYCNEDLFLMEVQHRDAESYDLTLIELTGAEH
ncbi:grainyhead-like [Homarus americanus]|uniref:Grainyhead-like n=1 Tax=Homarus americanus TaxID=6706 RepID=A0A8J5JIK3_HOMAM|nr:grainyhead-like [Homarus americanus]